MIVLSQDKRDALIKTIANAPDEILIDAARQYKDWQSNIQESFREVQGFCGCKAVDNTKPPFAPAATSSPEGAAPPAPAAGAPTQRANKNPGRPGISKIGTKTVDELLGMIRKGVQPGEKWKEHLKLLWSRDMVKWDGQRWYE